MKISNKLLAKLIMEELSDSTSAVMANNREMSDVKELPTEVQSRVQQAVQVLKQFGGDMKSSSDVISSVYGNQLSQALQQKILDMIAFLEPIADKGIPLKKLDEGVGSNCSLSEDQIRMLGRKVRELHGSGTLTAEEGLSFMEALRYAAGI